MQTACNTLPSPNDPALNAPTITARAPYTLPDLDSLDRETQCAPAWPDTIAGRIAALLPGHRAYQLTHCRVGGFIFKFADGHRMWRQSYPCQLAYCSFCAMDQADNQYEKYRHLAEFIEHRFTRITVPLTIPDTSTVRACFDALMKSLRRLLPRTPTVAKIRPSSNTVEILCTTILDESTITAIRRLHPSAMIRHHYLSNFQRELQHVTNADQTMLYSPEIAAAFERRYHKTRLLRTQGMTRAQRQKLISYALRDKLSDSGDESSSDGPESTQKSPSPAPKYYHRTASGRLMLVPACPCGCGAPPTHFAQGRFEHDDPSKLSWNPLDIVTEEQRIIEANQLKTQSVMIL